MLAHARPSAGSSRPIAPVERVRVQRVGRHAELLADAVLEQAVDDDDVAPDQLLLSGHPLPDDGAVMGDELEVEARDPAARVALAASTPA